MKRKFSVSDEVRGNHGPEMVQVLALVRLDLDHDQFVEADQVVLLPAPSALRLAELGLVQVFDVLPLEEPPVVAVVEEPE